MATTARGHAPSSHARLHKRASSASSMTSPLSPLSDVAAFTFNRTDTPKVTYEEPWTTNDPPRHMPAAASAHPIKIKPYLRKLSSKDSNALDLSRPAAENEGLAGLGIAEYNGYTRSASDVNFSPINGRNRHTRSTSNTSQFSTSSSLRPTAPFMPSIRQTPRPYTPPISKSTPSSVLDGDHGADDIMTDEEFRFRQSAFDPSRRSGSISSSTPGITPPLRIHTTGSSSRLAGSYSQSSVSLTSPVGPSRARGDTLKSVDTHSPSSRTSFDKAFGFIRGGRESPVDPASRAASIRAARQAFAEKEGAKERKYEKEASKQAEKHYRKQYKKEERQRRKSDAQEPMEHTRARSISDPNEKGTPRPSIGGRQYSDHGRPHASTLPTQMHYTIDEEKRTNTVPQVTKTRAAKGRWLRFVAWFKTRVLRISRGLHKS